MNKKFLKILTTCLMISLLLGLLQIPAFADETENQETGIEVLESTEANFIEENDTQTEIEGDEQNSESSEEVLSDTDSVEEETVEVQADIDVSEQESTDGSSDEAQEKVTTGQIEDFEETVTEEFSSSQQSTDEQVQEEINNEENPKQTDADKKPVTVKSENPVIIPVEKINLNKTELVIKEGETFSLIASITPEDATKQELLFESSNDKVAKVDKDGIITAEGIGTAEIKVSASDESQQTISCKVTVKAEIKNTKISLSKTSFVYTGAARKPAVTIEYKESVLKKGTDYAVEYSNNVKAGTAKVKITGKGYYTGSITKTFKITSKSIKKFKVTGIKKSYVYSGKAVSPSPVVTDGKVTLKKGRDYTVACSNNKAIGTAKITITGKGNYNGKIVKTYKLKIGTGLYKVKGIWKYYSKGKFTKKTGLVKRVTDQKLCYVEKGIFKPVTGLIKTGGKWKYVKKGVFTEATGLVKRISDGKLFYVEKGAYKKASGVTKRVSDGKYFYIEKGTVSYKTGIAKNLSDGKFMYVEKGTFKSVTGLGKRISDGKKMYVVKGYFNKATGLVKSLYDDKLYYVENGIFAKKTGIVERLSNGKLYFVKNGVFTKSTGYANRVSDGKSMYVYEGEYKNTVMTANQYVDKLKFAAKIKTMYWNQYPYNCGYMHSNGVVSWDCLNLVKTILNGWQYNTEADSFCNNFSNTGDCTELGLLDQCTDVSDDFTKLKKVSLLYMPGHIGSYIGKNVEIHGNIYNVIECTSRWGGGVFYTYVDKYGGRYNHKDGTYLDSDWTRHGTMSKWLVYSTSKIK